MDETDVIGVIGRFGIYHGIVLLLACLRAFPVAWTNMMSPLMAADVPHWCAPPDDSIDPGWWKEFGIPRTIQGTLEECVMFEWKERQGVLNSTAPIPCSNGWVYDKDQYGETATSEWNLVCGDAWKKSAMQSIVMAGSLVGVLVFGKLSDMYGRKNSFFGGVIVILITGISATFAGSFLTFNILRCILAASTTGMTAAIVTMFMEIMPSKDRILMNIGFGIGYTLPLMFIPLLSYFLQNFRHMQLAIGLSALMLIPFAFFIQESPKWLLVKNRIDEAESAVEKILKMNKRPVPPMGDVMRKLVKSVEAADSTKIKSLGFTDIICIGALRRNALLLGTMWCMGAFNNNYLFLNAHRGPGNPHINFAISAFSGVPSALVTMYVIRKYPRRPSQMVPNILAVAIFIVIFMLSDEYRWTKILGITFVRFLLSIVLKVKWVAIHEIFPTPARSTGFAVCQMCSRFGAISAPFLRDITDKTHYMVPLLFFTFLGLADATCTYFLPETLNKRLPDTVEDVILLRESREDKVDQ